MRGPWIGLLATAVELEVSVLPQTEQRAALMFSRVPHVGHILVVLGEVSGLIVSLKKYRGDPRFGDCNTGFERTSTALVDDPYPLCYPSIEMDQYSLYLHVPFCRHRCSYCDFNTFAHQEKWIPAYGQAICQEIERIVALAKGSSGDRLPVHTVFFGGGTPSLLPLNIIDDIFTTLFANFNFLPAAEITLEANPGTVNLEYLQGLRRLGANRLSFGMQSAHPDDLRLLEREHDFFDVVQAVRWARQAGFQNLSLDLIFGLPEQTLDRWQATVERALGLNPEHLSLYSLTIEHGTPLEKRYKRGLVPVPDDDLAADMYEYTQQRLEQAGFHQYEISNFARTGPDGELLSCRHNLQYWYNLPYLGFGAGAHGFAGGMRTMNVGGIRPYIERCQNPAPTGSVFPAGPATRRTISIDRRTEMQETMMVGLRLTLEGISVQAFKDRFGEPPEDAFSNEIHPLLRSGLLEYHMQAGSQHLRLTPRGRMLGNQVFMHFVGD
jgi:oxygen-independent coproporphyrinogen III oxidase